MTSPIVLQQPGWGEALQKGLAPLLAALQQKQQQDMQQQQLVTEAGHLKLAQDKFAADQEETKQRKQQLAVAQAGLEKRLKALEAPAATPQAQPPQQPGVPVGAGLGGSLPTMQMPQQPPPPSIGEPPLATAASIRMLVAEGSPQSLKAASDLLDEEVTYRRAQDVLSKYGAGATTPEGRATLIAQMSGADPRRAQALGQMFQTMENRPRTQIRSLLGNDGQYHDTLVNMTTGERVEDLGPSRASWVERLLKWGDADQRTRAQGAGRMYLAWKNMDNLKGNRNAFAEAAKVATAIGAEMQFPTNIGDFTAEATRIAAQQNVSEDAQQILNNLWDFIAAESFSNGGKQLTRMEYTLSTRALAPVSGESDASWREKFQKMRSRWTTQARLAGGAWSLIKDDLPGLVFQEESPQGAGATDPLDTQMADLLKRIRAKRGGGQ